MKAFILALAEVSRLRLQPLLAADEASIQPRREAAKQEWIVLARSSLAIVAALIATLLLWMIKDPLVGALLATAGFCAFRAALAVAYEREGAVALLHKLYPGRLASDTEQYYRQAIFQLLLILRPLAVFCLCWRGHCLWLVVGATLATAVMTELTMGTDAPAQRDDDNASRSGLKFSVPRHWLVAWLIVLLITGFGSRLFAGQGNVFIQGILASLVAWLMPPMLVRFVPVDSFARLEHARAAYLYLGELIVLLIGLLGLAL